MSTALKIRSDGTTEIIEYHVKDTLKVLQAAVASGRSPAYIERIGEVTIGDLTFDMWVNEEGRLHGLDVNHVATRLTDACFEHAPAVVGDIVVTGLANRNGNITSLPDRHAEVIVAFAALHHLI
jgi:hypothetical protein